MFNIMQYFLVYLGGSDADGYARELSLSFD